MRRPLIAGNWKMHTSLAEARQLAAQVAAETPPDIDVVVCPPFPWLVPVADAVAGSAVAIGAQNCWTEASGAFTGEVSATMLADVCHYVIVGHSERRRLFGDTDALVAAKALAVLSAGIQPIVCVGEVLAERQAGDANAVVVRQLHAALANLSLDQLQRCVVAYEPVWAIGTGVSATPVDAAEMAGVIRNYVGTLNATAAETVQILYGGSVTAENARALLAAPDVDGALVGGASLKAPSFLAIVEAARR